MANGTRAAAVVLAILTVGACRSKDEAAPGAAAPAPSIAAAPAAQTQTTTQGAPAAAEANLLPVGTAAPDVELKTHTGQTLKLSELKGKPVVLYFYPKDNTPGCTVQAQELRDAWSDVQKTGAVVVGVSADEQASHESFASEHKLPFALVPDPDLSVARAFGVPTNNGRAKRVTYVIGPDGKVAKVFPEVTPRGSARELVTALNGLKS